MKELRNYTNEELEKELLSRKNYQFNKEGCTKKAELYWAKKVGCWEIQRNPICLSCCEWMNDKMEEEKVERD
jgi:hypothetical protein